MNITASTPLYAVLGNPVSHSQSPNLHNGWILDYSLDGVYVALPIDLNDFELVLDGLFAAGLAGGSVTIPFKERTSQHLGKCTPQASRIGSVNCLVRDADGFVGHSTDGEGLVADLDARVPGWRDVDGHAVVLGAGGASRAIIQALHDTGIDNIHVVNRTFSRAEETCAVISQPHVVAKTWQSLDDSLFGAGLVINATSAGLGGHNPLAIDVSQTQKDAVIYDCVYAPRQTALIECAKAQHRRTCDGLGMLAGQGALAFEYWFGIKPDFATGLKRLEAALLT
jgi:shikimate dehydrogenase